MSDEWEYVKGAALPDAAITWRDWNGALLQLATGHTFELKIATELGVAPALTKTAGLTGANTDPNLTVVWAISGEITTLVSGLYVVQIVAIRTSDSKRRNFKFLPLRIRPSIP
jgi:hypothetical protein